jgi:hypothetical protein
MQKEELHDSIARYHYNNQIKKDERDNASCMNGTEEKFIQNFGRKTSYA